jgi:hypothetical protein
MAAVHHIPPFATQRSTGPPAISIMSCFYPRSRALFFCITALRHHRVSNRNLSFPLAPRIAGITLITDRGCNRPQANSTILCATIRIGPSLCAELLSIHLRSPIEFMLCPSEGRQRPSKCAAARWRRNTSAEWRIDTTIDAAQPATDDRMNLRYLVRYVGLLPPFSARMDRAPVRVASQRARKRSVSYYRKFLSVCDLNTTLVK